MRWLVLLLVLAGEPRGDPAGECERDDECVMSDGGPCCFQCPSAPIAWSKKALASYQFICRINDCAGSERRVCKKPKRARKQVARCVQQHCVAR